MRSYKCLIGQKFGKLTVISEAPPTVGNRGKRWISVCECGGTSTSRTDRLTSGLAKSCGCLSVEIASKLNARHGMYKSREYLAWANMIARCTRRQSKSYKNYGGRGITVSSEWMKSFEVFFSHVGYSPGKGYELDRIDNDGNYEPGNVRWVTKKENNENKRPRRKEH